MKDARIEWLVLYSNPDFLDSTRRFNSYAAAQDFIARLSGTWELRHVIDYRVDIGCNN